MKFVAVAVVAFVAIHSASAAFKVLPAPWCVCGTAYKLKLDPLAVQWPGITINNPSSSCNPPLTTYDLNRPVCALAQMKQNFLDTLANPLAPSPCSSCYPVSRPPWPTCGCN